MRVRLISCISLVLVFACSMSCKNEKQVDPFHPYYKTIPWVENPPKKEPFPRASKTSESLRRVFATAETAREVFPLERVIKLELTDESIITQIGEVLFVQDHWIILDKFQMKLLKFSEDGQFRGFIGRQGEGPGEYRTIEFPCIVWGDHIGVVDLMRGKALVYDIDGRLIRETQTPGTEGDGGKFPVTNAFIWNRPDRFYLADYSRIPHVPQHVVLDYAKEKGELLYGFGKRNDLLEAWAVSNRAIKFIFNSFIQVGDTIWAAVPWGSHINVYDLEGHLLGNVTGPHPDNLTYEDYRTMTPSIEAQKRLLVQKSRNYRLIHYNGLILQHLGHGGKQIFNIYDSGGDLLGAGLKADFSISSVKTTTDQHLVNAFPVLDTLARYQSFVDPQELALLEESGWDPNDFSGDNEYLFLRGITEP